MKKNNISRRDFLKTGALSTAGIISLNGTQKNGRFHKKISLPGDAKNIIFLVSDGMSAGSLALADIVKQNKYGDKTNWIKLYESDRPYHRGLMDMAALNSPVTGSAAAASSWGCGHRINNVAVNWGPNDEQYKPICSIFNDAGKATGLVTTTRITHATPSGFSINMPSRWQEDEIAAQHLERNIDVLMGGGNRHFEASMRDDKRDLYAEFQKKGYGVARMKSDISKAAQNDKLLGIFADSHLPYTVDHNHDSRLQLSVPTLSEMTKTALKKLSANNNGFILQIEGGRVDHGAHSNDAAGIIYDQIAFDDAIKTVMDFTDGRDDTLVILTTDHGNANPGLNGLGERYDDSPDMLATMHDYRHSFEWIQDQLGDNSDIGQISLNRIQNVIEEATETGITKREAGLIKQAMSGNYHTAFHDRSKPQAVMAGVLANYNGIYFTGTNHTSDYVELAAWGPGHEKLSNFTRNTQLFDLMVEMAGVRDYA